MTIKLKIIKKGIVVIDMIINHFLISSKSDKINHLKYLFKNENELMKC